MFDNADDFLKKFSLEKNGDYFSEIALKDRKVGFSIKRKYPKDIPYKPSITSDGEDNNVAIIWVIYKHPSESNDPKTNNLIPISLRICNVDLYANSHLDYNFSDKKCPTKESLEVSQKTPHPTDLISANEFFYNHETDSFVDTRNTKMSGLDMLNIIFDKHCSTTRGIPRVKMRFLEFIKDFFSSKKIDSVINGLKWTLKNIFGRTIEDNDEISEFLYGYELSSLKKLSTDTFEIFNYRASKGIVVLFCFLALVSTVLIDFNSDKYQFIRYIIDNNLLALCFSIVALFILDIIVPFLLFKLINFVIRLRFKIMHLSINV